MFFLFYSIHNLTDALVDTLSVISKSEGTLGEHEQRKELHMEELVVKFFGGAAQTPRANPPSHGKFRVCWAVDLKMYDLTGKEVFFNAI